MRSFFTALKSTVKRRAPWLIPFYSFVCWNLIIRPKYRRAGMGVFADHYRTNAWGSLESVSGTGSCLAETAFVRTALPDIAKQFGVTTLLDIPCGDFNWMKEVDLSRLHYIGADIVEKLIAENKQRFSDDKKQFLTLDLTTDLLPQADMIFCRDCLFHFSFLDIKRATTNIRRSGAKFLLTTTYPMLAKNRDIVTGEWRFLNLQVAPFFFPEPLILINEKNCSSQNQNVENKHLGLWRIRDLPASNN